MTSTINFNGQVQVPWSLLPHPNPIDPPKVAVYPTTSCIPNCITAGESVSFIGPSGDICLGRILKIKFENHVPVLLMQLYLRASTFDGGRFALDEIGDVLKPHVTGISEVVETNKSVWVGIDDISSLVFIIHESNIIKNTYGPIAWRENTFFLRYRYRYSSSCMPSPTQKDTIDPDDGRFADFRSSPHFRPEETLSERLMFGLKNEAEKSIKMLFRAGRLTGRTQSRTEPKLRE